MLKTLTVSNFALIEHVEIDFSGGLNVLTGETGAGKSILVDALNTILGSRVSTDSIRSGTDFFRVEALFTLEANSGVHDILADQCIPIEDDNMLIIRRTLSRQGKSVTLVNGFHVTLGVLRQIGSELIDMHGQHENQSLLKPDSYLALVDSFIPETKVLLESYRSVYGAWSEIVAEINKMESDSRERAQRIDMLKWQTEEIAAADLHADEEESINQEIKIQAHGEKLIKGVGRAYSLLNESGKANGGLLSDLAEIKKELETLCRYDPSLNKYISVINDALYQLEEIESDLRNYCENLDFNPGRLADLQARMDTIHRLKRKYGTTIPQILDYFGQSVNELECLSNYDERITGLTARRGELENQLAKGAENLNIYRHRAAKTMSELICSHLEQLGMPKAKIIIDVKTLPNYTAKGCNEVSIMFSANPGEDPRPLNRVASGGELSRIALAIKTVGSARESVGTMVFDEVDSGVGGQIGHMVAEKIAKVSQDTQVLCISHLPQIAAMADYHIYVEKITDGTRTRTEVKILEEEEHRLQVTRMISGDNLSSAALKNAAEMIDSARKKKVNMVK